MLNAELYQPEQELRAMLGHLWPRGSGLVEGTRELVGFGDHEPRTLGRHGASVIFMPYVQHFYTALPARKSTLGAALKWCDRGL